jgi:hypothetical protein
MAITAPTVIVPVLFALSSCFRFIFPVFVIWNLNSESWRCCPSVNVSVQFVTGTSLIPDSNNNVFEAALKHIITCFIMTASTL